MFLAPHTFDPAEECNDTSVPPEFAWLLQQKGYRNMEISTDDFHCYNRLGTVDAKDPVNRAIANYFNSCRELIYRAWQRQETAFVADDAHHGEHIAA